jgi:hypothetical protein
VQVKLRVNVITGGKLIPLGSIVELDEMPDNVRKNKQYWEDVEAWRRGKVMLLRDVMCNQKLHDPNNPDIPTTYSVELRAGSLIKLSDLSLRERENLKEGVDFTREFTREQSEELLGRQEVLVDTNQEMSMEELQLMGRSRF